MVEWAVRRKDASQRAQAARSEVLPTVRTHRLEADLCVCSRRGSLFRCKIALRCAPRDSSSDTYLEARSNRVGLESTHAVESTTSQPFG